MKIYAVVPAVPLKIHVKFVGAAEAVRDTSAPEKKPRFREIDRRTICAHALVSVPSCQSKGPVIDGVILFIIFGFFSFPY
jgi:hypothetical protein